MIDAHAHVWVKAPQKYPWAPIGGYVPDVEAPVEQLIRYMDASDVEKAVLVQPTPYGWNNSYVMDCAIRYSERLAVICLVDPLSESCDETLAGLFNIEPVKGVRLNWHLQSPEVWLDNLSHSQLWRTVETLDATVCIQMTYAYLDMLEKFSQEYPRVKIIVDHMARPPRGWAMNEAEFSRFLKLAQYENIYIKLSGLNYYSDLQWPFEDVWPLIKSTVSEFGASRCLWGSDFPFILEHWPSYNSMLQSVRNDWGISGQEAEWILGKTAQMLWWRKQP